MKKMMAGFLAASAVVSVLAGCSSEDGGSGADEDSNGNGNGKTVLKLAAFEGGYGRDMYAEVVEAYEAANPDVDVELQISKTIAQELAPKVASGDYPDVVVLGQGGETGFTEGFVRDRALEDLTGVLDLPIPGEDVTVGDKLTEGIVGNLSTNPYGDDGVYLMPLYASPTGLMYNKGLFEEKGWELPTSWDEFFALGDTAAAEDISLFTYPTAGYLDSFLFSLLSATGGEDFYERVMTYEEDIWTSAEATEALDLTTRLLTDYTAEQTVGYANSQDFTKNQQAILDDTTLFMPNGSWIVNEMADAPRSDDFQWGLLPVPAPEAGGERYLTTFVESAWVPAAAENKDAAKDFIAYLYSDEAADIFAKATAIQPIKGLAERLDGEAAEFYSVYEQDGVNALVGSFAATKPVAGVDIKATLFDTANSVVEGKTSEEAWQSAVNEANNELSAAAE